MKKQMIVAPLIMVLVIAAWYLVWCRPQLERQGQISQQIAEQQKTVIAYRTALAHYQQWKNEYRQMYAQLDTSGAVFAGKEEVVSLYLTLDTLCRQAAIHLDEITPSLEELIRYLRECEKTDSAITVTMRLKVRGEYRSLAGIVETVEKANYFDRPATMQMHGSDELNPECALDFSFVANLGKRLETADHD
jgi:Tfp pilus assembly protein PilO